MKKLLILVGLVSLVGACSQDTAPDASTTSTCQIAKCDAASLSELTAIDSGFGLCTVTPDLDAADDFFALEEWTCQFVGFEDALPLKLRNVFTYSMQAGGNFSSTVDFTAAELDGTTKRAGAWRIDKYPVTTVVAPTLSLVTSDTARVGESSPNLSGASMKIESVITSRPTEATQQAISANMKFWPVVIWPTAEFAQKFEGGDISFFSVNIVGKIATDEGRSNNIRYGRYAVRGDDLKGLPNTKFFVPVQPEFPPTLELRLESNDVTSTGSIDGPGYYLMGIDGSLTKATVAEVTERGMSRASAAVPVSDAGPDVSLDAGTDVEVDVAAPVVDPCMDTCAADQACVNTACVSLATQVQTNCNSTATAVCDGEDTDCAAGNICAGGKCRLSTCQSQDQYCNAATKPCEESTDCAADHVCTSGVCTRLSCKAQDQYCNAPKGTCVADNAECPADHVCAEGKCKLLKCQEQDQYCNAPKGACDDDDNDCAAEQVCVAGQCRRLTCQAQDQYCNTPKGACDEGEATDCPDGHVCEAGKCKRLTCL